MTRQPAVPSGAGGPWPGTLLLAVAVAVALAGSSLWWSRTVDDAFIVFRYADNVVAGNGPVFNPGERVEGYTSPSWLVLAAAAVGGGVDPELLAKLCGLLATALLPVALYSALRRWAVPSWGAGLAALLLGSSAVLQIWSVAGLETNAYALLFFAGLAVLADASASTRRAVLCSAALVAAALTRPEGLGYWLLGLAWIVVSARARGRLHVTAAYAGPGLLLLAHFVWRLLYYGRPFPNTYYVKTGGGAEMWQQGLHGLSGFVFEPSHATWLIAAAAGAVVALGRPRLRAPVGIMAVATLLHLLYVVSVGDDGLRVHRFYVPVLAPLAFLVGLLFVGNGRSARIRVIAGGVAIALGASLSAWALAQRHLPALHEGMLVYQEGNVKLGRHLRATRSPDTRIAVAAAGAIPYYSGLPSIDMYGLNDRHIAGGPFPRGVRGRLMKWDNAYVLRLRPDLIAINRGYFPAGDPLVRDAARQPSMLASAPMDRDLFERVARDGSYALRPLRLDDGSTFFVFERRN